MKTDSKTKLLLEGKIVSSKRIVFFLRRFMNLHPDPGEAWRTIKRWKKKYDLPIHREINGQPSIIPEEIMLYFALSPEGLVEGVTKGEFLRLLKKSQ